MRRCSACGEELMGAVNRCWRCGSSQIVDATQTRSARVEARTPAETGAEYAAETGAESAAERGAEPAAEASRDGVEGNSRAGQDGGTLHVGSPFKPAVPQESQDGTATEPDMAAHPEPASSRPSKGPESRAPLVPVYPQHLAALSGGIGALLLGVMALLCLVVIPLGSVLIALVGIAFGTWGLYARRKEPAVFGILLCVIALGAGCYLTVVEWYIYVYGVSPWETDPSLLPAEPLEP